MVSSFLSLCPFLKKKKKGSLVADDSSDSSQLLTPRTQHRRRSSVMFSDVVSEHRGMDGAQSSPQSSVQASNVNVCWNEKTTQTEDSTGARRGSSSPVVVSATGISVIMPGNETVALVSPIPSPLPLSRKPSASFKRRQSRATTDERSVPSYSAPGPGPGAPAGGLTCQELLALSGALGAALPTPLALPSSSYVVDELPPSTVSGTTTTGPPASSSSNNKPHNNNNQLAPPGVMPILPTLAMALWPEPSSYSPAGKLSAVFVKLFSFLLLRKDGGSCQLCLCVPGRREKEKGRGSVRSGLLSITSYINGRCTPTSSGSRAGQILLRDVRACPT